MRYEANFKLKKNVFISAYNRPTNVVPSVPSSYTPFPPNLICAEVGSEIYTVGSHIYHAMWVHNELTGNGRKAPSMMMNQRIGLRFSTQRLKLGNLYRTLAPEVRFSLNKKILPMDGNICVTIKKKNVESKKKKKNVESKNKKKDFVYLLKEKKWEVVKDHSSLVEKYCVIENVEYTYADKRCWWMETTSSEESSEEWRLVNGLTGLDAYVINDTEFCTYGGKLLLFWDSPALSPLDQTKKIWCAVILLDKSLNDEVSGQIEWADVVLTVPVSYTLWDCVKFSTYSTICFPVLFFNTQTHT
ncbi:hypothetical protein AXX17_AT4G44420 [Arabidopsis thaliana]|uniref:FKB95-like N-terminal Kelch domain-containing protein n=2 Tax=Arabidopsis TaxID=3701 RepID=A0A178V1G3_ARATH|nr:hypothetical protein AXX17_AT4G44420 [Arabidopsis thaliana]